MLCRTQGGGARNRKKEKVLLQAKGQIHSGAQGVLSRHKNANCKRCIKENWLRKKKRKSGNHLQLMTKPEQMWQEKWSAKKEGCSSGEQSYPSQRGRQPKIG
jgi:hypothetical protein